MRVLEFSEQIFEFFTENTFLSFYFAGWYYFLLLNLLIRPRKSTLQSQYNAAMFSIAIFLLKIQLNSMINHRCVLPIRKSNEVVYITKFEEVSVSKLPEKRHFYFKIFQKIEFCTLDLWKKQLLTFWFSFSNRIFVLKSSLIKKFPF